MRQLAASIAFLTRIPVPRAGSFGAGDVGKSARWFPLVGLLLGAFYALMAWLMGLRLPAHVIAVLIVIAEALLTGALHMDGLADTADGFGGGRSRDDVLRIMRDHAIGSYGATALILLVALKVTAAGALILCGRATPYLVLAPALGRWTILPLSRFLPYVRDSKAVADSIGATELVWASVIAAAAAIALLRWQGLACWCAVMAATTLFGWLCKRRIGGVTGDTLGAGVQIGECIVLVTGLALP